MRWESSGSEVEIKWKGSRNLVGVRWESSGREVQI